MKTKTKTDCQCKFYQGASCAKCAPKSSRRFRVSELSDDVPAEIVESVEKTGTEVMKAKHTPGPWMHRLIYDAEGR